MYFELNPTSPQRPRKILVQSSILNPFPVFKILQHLFFFFFANYGTTCSSRRATKIDKSLSNIATFLYLIFLIQFSSFLVKDFEESINVIIFVFLPCILMLIYSAAQKCRPNRKGARSISHHSARKKHSSYPELQKII